MKRICYIIIGMTMLFACSKEKGEDLSGKAEETDTVSSQILYYCSKTSPGKDTSELANNTIAITPTLDCAPAIIAYERGLFKANKLDVQLALFNSQMDQDTALMNGHVIGMFTDSLKVEHLKQKGVKLTAIAPTSAYWLLVANKTSRVTKLQQMGDKILAETSYSALDYLTDKVLAKVNTTEQIYRIYIYDVNVRYNMLLTNNLDALWLPEPYASSALNAGHKLLADSRKINPRLGVIAFSDEVLKGKNKERVDSIMLCIEQANDSIKQYGIEHYDDCLKKYYR